LVISISFSNETSLLEYGYKLIPKQFDLTAYKYVFENPTQLINSYKVNVFTGIVGTFFSVFVMALVAYPLSRDYFKYKKIITFYIFFTMLFGGGLIPTYILVTQYLMLGNNIIIYLLLGLANAFHIIILKTFFQSLPPSLVESAKIDGAGEFRIFYQIIIPLSKPVIATVALLTLLTKWNDWYTSLIYIRDKELYTLQYLLQRILREAEFLKTMAQDVPSGINIELTKTPTESMRFAMAIIAAGPMLIVFPFFQKYFTKGLTVGAIKG
jgi:putative aldouronate transport system permease protein